MLLLTPWLLALTGCASTDGGPVAPHDPTSAAVIAEHQAFLTGFGDAYGYDVGYMEQLLHLSPRAYDAFAGIFEISEFRSELPVDAHFVARVSAMLADDCGACTQLGLQMAVEAGVDREVLRILLEEPAGLPPLLYLVHEYATQISRGENANAEAVGELKAAFGDAAFGELVTTVLGTRFYPALRRAMGAEVACPPPTLDF